MTQESSLEHTPILLIPLPSTKLQNNKPIENASYMKNNPYLVQALVS